MTKIYICSPYRGKDENEVGRHVNNAINYCRHVIDDFSEKMIPIAPHLYLPQFLCDDVDEEREKALKIGLELLKDCSELWVFGKEVSDGMAAEISAAAQYGLKVRWFLEDLTERTVTL